MLTQEDKINIELLKKIMSDNKTKLPSFKNQNWKKKSMVETERINIFY